MNDRGSQRTTELGFRQAGLGLREAFSGGTLKFSLPCANSLVSSRWGGWFVLQLRCAAASLLYCLAYLS